MAVKGPNIVVVVCGAGYLVARAWVGRGARPGEAGMRTAREYVTATAGLLGGAAAASVTWVVVRAAIALPGTTPMEEAERTGMLRPAQVLENVARFITPWDREPSSLYPLAVITSYLFVAFLILAVMTLSRGDVRWSLATVVAIVLLFGPLLLVAVNFVVRGSYAIVEPRYGTTLVPAQCAIAASFWSGRALTAVAALAVVAPTAVLLRLLL